MPALIIPVFCRQLVLGLCEEERFIEQKSTKILQELQCQKLSVTGGKRSENGPNIPYYSRTETLWFSFEVLKMKGFGVGFFPQKKRGGRGLSLVDNFSY